MKIFKRLKWALPLSMLMALVFFGAALAIANVIDHFDTTQTLTLTYSSMVSGSNAVADTSVPGGERDFVGNITIGQNGQTLVMQSNNANDSLFTIASGNSVAGWSEIQYDGSADNPKSDIDYTGLGSQNLNLLGNRFIMTVVFDDRPADIIVTAYTDANNWSQAIVNLPGSIDISNLLIADIPFSSFTQGGTNGPANFSSIGALTFRIDATNFVTSAGLDLTIHLIAIAGDNYLDFGDLPESPVPGGNYNTVLPNGARNLVTTTSVLLGNNVSLEGDGQPSTAADADAFDDGVVQTAGFNWSQAGGGSVDITVSGCPQEPCYVSAWIDWNQDGDFGTWPSWDTGELILSDLPVNNGPNPGITFPIPVDVDGQEFYSRFRIYENAIAPFNSANNAMYSGETEDFLWGFGPNAIELVNLKADNNTSLIIAVAGLLILLVSGGVLLAYKRSRA